MPKSSEYKQIAIDKLMRGQYQPRQQFDDVQLLELAKAIESTKGLLQPIIVRELTADKYEIIAGERRWRAAMLAGLDSVSCIVRQCSDQEALEIAIIENISRCDLNPIEEAHAYQRLMNEFRYTHEQIAKSVGKSRAKITNSLRLLKLDHLVQAFLIEGGLSEGHGKILASLPYSLQTELAEMSMKQGWSVRKIEHEAKKRLNQKIIPGEERDANIQALEKALGEYLGCPVKIDCKNNYGKLEINFYNLEILDGVLAKMHFPKTMF
jgi:ParB family transcriptional regulator, chromosome partitioning protein